MAKTYKILVNDGKGTDIQPVRVMQGGEPVRVLAKRGWRFELQDDLKGKSVAPDQVRVKRVGKSLTLMFDGSQRADVVIEDYYAENTDKDKDNGMPKLVGTAENGGMYEYVPQDPAVSSMPAELKDGNTPVIVSLGGGPLGDDFVLSALPLVAAAGGVSGWLVAGGVAAAAAAGGGGGGGAAIVKVSAPTVSIEADLNNDGYVNKKEFDLLADKTKFTVKTTIPTTAIVGDTIIVTDGTTEFKHVLTATDITNKFVTDAFVKPTEGNSINVTAKMTNAAGASSDTATDTAKLDTSAFIEPVNPDPFNPVDASKSGLRVTINSDDNNDGYLSNYDLGTADLVTVTVALTKDAAVGDVLTVTATGNTTRTITLTAEDIAAKQVVLKGLTAPGEGSAIDVTATIQDAAGNKSPSPATDSATVNTAMPGVLITNDENNDGYINKAESDKASRVSVRIEVPKLAQVGQTVTVTDGISTPVLHVLTDADIASKSFTLVNAFPKPVEGSSIEIKAMFGETTGIDSARLDTGASNADAGLGVRITTDANDDAFVNAKEVGDSTTFTSRVMFDKTKVAAGDSIVITVQNGTDTPVVVTHVLTTADLQTNESGKGFVDVTFIKPSSELKQTVSVNFVDVLGNVATDAKPIDSATLDVTPPNNEDVDLGVRIITDAGNTGGDGVASGAELTAQGDVNNFISRATFDKTKAIAGHKIVFTAKNGIDADIVWTHILTTTDLATNDGTGKGFVDHSFAKPLNGQTQTVTAMYADAAGNMDSTNPPTDLASLDDAAPNGGAAPIVRVTTDGANNGTDDGFVNTPELNGATLYNVEASFDSSTVAVGDKVIFTVAGTPDVTVTIDQAMKNVGKATTSFTAPTANGAIFTVSAVIKDALSNATAQGTDSATRNFLVAADDTNAITVPTLLTAPQNVIANDVDPQFLTNLVSVEPPKVVVTGVKFGDAQNFAAVDNSGATVLGEFGRLLISSNGIYTYTLNNDAKVDALKATDTRIEKFTYQATDVAGNVGTAILKVSVTGVNDIASHILKDEKNLLINDSNNNPLSSAVDSLVITDKDNGDSALPGVATSGPTSFTGFYGSLALTQSSSTSTSTGYSYLYTKANGLVSSSDTLRHDLFTFKSNDGTDSVTFDIQLGATGTVVANEFHAKSTAGLKIATASAGTKDTLVLDGQMTFDFTGTVASTDITHIDVINITGTGNNTIKVDVSTIEQAGSSTALHQLFVDGNAGDQVQLVNGSHVLTADTTSVPSYDRYVVDSTHELLIQHAITISFIS